MGEKNKNLSGTPIERESQKNNFPSHERCRQTPINISIFFCTVIFFL